MDIDAWWRWFEASSAPGRAVRDAESVVLEARHRQLKAVVDDPDLSCEQRLALGRELQGLFDASYVMCKADLAELNAVNWASRARSEEWRRRGATDEDAS